MSKRFAPENRINDITRAAITVFRQKGFRQAQMVDIAREAGLSPGALYTYFESKSHLFVYVIMNGAPQEGKSMPPPQESSARTEGDLIEILNSYVRTRARLASANEFLETKLEDIDLATEITTILGEWWDLMEENHVQIAIIEKSAAEFPEMAQVYFRDADRYTVEQIEQYLSLRMRQGVIRKLNSARGMARAMSESLSWFGWKQFDRETAPHQRKEEILPDLALTFARGLQAYGSTNERT